MNFGREKAQRRQYIGKEVVFLSILVEMLGRNQPLYRWRDYAGESEKAAEYRSAGGSGYWSNKKLDNMAGAVVSALSHPAVVELVAREWEILPPLMRIRITQMANDRRLVGAASNNGSKGIKRLDALLGGKLLRRVDERATNRDLRVINGQLVSVQRRLNPAVVGAEQAFGAFAKPTGYEKWPAAQKRRWAKEMAKERRGLRR